MHNLLPWIIAALSALAALGMGAALLLRRKARSRKPLPTEWSLTARPIFSSDERRVFRLLREALPHHVVMCKLPLVRFCQPTEAKDVRYWYELLGGISVNFAICSPNGRVLAAVDLGTDRPGSSRTLQIKQAVLGACRIRYLRCAADHLPSAAELQLLVPYSNQSLRTTAPVSARPGTPRTAPASSVTALPALRPAPVASVRNTLWNESPVFSDSFFAPDSRYDPFGGADSSQHAPLDARVRGYRPRGPHAVDSPAPDSQLQEPLVNDIAGVVVDAPRYGRR